MPERRVTGLVFKALEALLVAMLGSLLAMVLANIVLRYAIGTGIFAAEELSRMFLVWIVFLGAVVATRDGTHLRVDSFVERLPPRARVACTVASELVVLACCALVFWGTFRQHDVSATSRSLVTGIPLIWVYGTGYVMSAGIGLLVAARIARLVRSSGRDDPQAAARRRAALAAERAL